MVKKIIGIVGLGYVGAPLAYLAAYKGYKVIGIDNNNKAVDKINYKINIPLQLKNKIGEIDLVASSNYSLLKSADIVIICVPTPTINHTPDLTNLKETIKSMAPFIKRKCLLIVESTVAPGMTRKYVEKYFYEYGTLRLNVDYELAYCPERIDPGNKEYWVGNINRVCGAASEDTLVKAHNFYKTIIDADIILMESIEEAELVKVWENSIRNMNIAQANLLAKICDKYDFSVNKIRNGLESKIKQFGNTLAFPGIGPGGHCIPEDIHYLIKTVENDKNIDMTLFKEAVKINEDMPRYVYNKMLNLMRKQGDMIENLNVLMLGKSYKANSDDLRCSQALVLYDIVTKENQNNFIFDPFTDDNKIEGVLEEKLKNADVVILGCPHDVFLKIEYEKYSNIKYILDCWNKLDREKIEKAGINYIGVGI